MSSGADHNTAGSSHRSAPRAHSAQFPGRPHHAASALAAGTPVGDYRLESVLGVNAFGVTYLASDPQANKVVIKEFFPADLATREGVRLHATDLTADDLMRRGRDRFLSDARRLQRIHHESIVRVHKVFEANGTAYMAVEHEPGPTLEEMLAGKKHDFDDEARLRRFALALVDGLDEVHAAAFLHGKVEPSNIRLRDGMPVLLDFGTARAALALNVRASMLRLTPGYAAIEQYTSHEAQGPWTDLYGLAATLYRAISGRDPLDAPARLLEDRMIPAVEAGSGRYNRGLLRAIDAALIVRPEDRPQTVAEWRPLLDAARAPKAQEFVENDLPDDDYIDRPEPRPPYWAYGAGAVGAVVIGFAVTAASWDLFVPSRVAQDRLPADSIYRTQQPNAAVTMAVPPADDAAALREQRQRETERQAAERLRADQQRLQQEAQQRQQQELQQRQQQEAQQRQAAEQQKQQAAEQQRQQQAAEQQRLAAERAEQQRQAQAAAAAAAAKAEQERQAQVAAAKAAEEQKQREAQQRAEQAKAEQAKADQERQAVEQQRQRDIAAARAAEEQRQRDIAAARAEEAKQREAQRQQEIARQQEAARQEQARQEAARQETERQQAAARAAEERQREAQRQQELARQQQEAARIERERQQDAIKTAEDSRRREEAQAREEARIRQEALVLEQQRAREEAERATVQATAAASAEPAAQATSTGSSAPEDSASAPTALVVAPSTQPAPSAPPRSLAPAPSVPVARAPVPSLIAPRPETSGNTQVAAAAPAARAASDVGRIEDVNWRWGYLVLQAERTGLQVGDRVYARAGDQKLWMTIRRVSGQQVSAVPDSDLQRYPSNGRVFRD